MTDAELEVLVLLKLKGGDADWVSAWIALQMLAVLRSVDARLAALDRALASHASGSIAGEPRNATDLLRLVVTKLNRTSGSQQKERADG
jgi:hypothetical protein